MGLKEHTLCFSSELFVEIKSDQNGIESVTLLPYRDYPVPG